MRHRLTTCVLLPKIVLLSLASLTFAGELAPARPVLDSDDEARLAFQEARFGLFVRWGLYSLLGKGERVMEHDKLPLSEYEKLPARFNPTEFDAEAWIKTVKAAGVRYLAVTAKDHDGFCMFDSKLTRYDVMDATPYAKDPLKAIADACRRNGVSLVVYYSLLDWHHPDYAPVGQTGRQAGRAPRGDWSKYLAYCQGQVRELCTNYGEIGGVWLDGVWDKPDADWGLAGTYALIHELQPKALVRNNHHAAPKAGEDVQVFERDMPGENNAGFNTAAPDPSLVWESCLPLNRSWGYNASDTRYKSAPEVIRLLVNAAGRDANLLLGVGPKPDGTLPAEAVDRLAEVGRWLESRGDSVYGTHRGPVAPRPWGVSTERTGGKRPASLYLHVLDPDASVRLPEAALSLDARLFGTDKTLKIVQEDKQAVIEIPKADRDPIDTIIELTPQVLEPERRVVKPRSLE